MTFTIRIRVRDGKVRILPGRRYYVHIAGCWTACGLSLLWSSYRAYTGGGTAWIAFIGGAIWGFNAVLAHRELKLAKVRVLREYRALNLNLGGDAR